jgi:protein tyrosine/serine phosphatase
LLDKIKAMPDQDGKNKLPDIPDYFWKASPAYMKKLLSTLKKEYGSVEKYLKEMGMAESLPRRLRKLLLN